MKCDPEGYENEILLLIRHFDSCLAVFQQHAALKSASMGSDPAVAKELGDLTMFLANLYIHLCSVFLFVTFSAY
jgi:hypothetical protein